MLKQVLGDEFDGIGRSMRRKSDLPLLGQFTQCLDQKGYYCLVKICADGQGVAFPSGSLSFGLRLGL